MIPGGVRYDTYVFALIVTIGGFLLLFKYPMFGIIYIVLGLLAMPSVYESIVSSEQFSKIPTFKDTYLILYLIVFFFTLFLFQNI